MLQLDVSFEVDADKIDTAYREAVTQALQRTGSDDRRSTDDPNRCSPIINSSPARLSKTIETADRDPGSHLRRAVEDAGKHVVALDRVLEDEVTRSIEFLSQLSYMTATRSSADCRSRMAVTKASGV